MVEDQFYLSDPSNTPRALELTGLTQDELEAVVGRFTKISSRAGQLRGQIKVLVDGTVQIWHHFHHKKLWEGPC